MVELDVTLTRDRKIVVIHDDTLNRTTSGHGRVRDKKLSEILTLDAGSWFSPVFASEKVPVLEDVLTLCRGNTLVNVEIKPEAVEHPMPDDAIEIQVLELIRRLGMTDSILISSFHRRVIQRMTGMKGPKPALALLSDEPLDDDTMQFMTECRVFSYHADHRILTSEQIRKTHDHGLKVLTYTVNTEEDARRCLDMGVDGFFTDDPAQFIRFLER